MTDRKQVTIYDVAEACGLSKGTVDRVVHKRGRVSADSRKKVENAIAELGYKPNAIASLLGSRSHHTIACLIPEWRDGNYWEKVYEGFVKAAGEEAPFGTVTSFFSYLDGDSESFDKACSEIILSHPDGVILRPLYPDVLSEGFIRELRDAGIPYSYVDNRISGDSSYLSYVGVDFAKSGRLGAYLMTEGISDFNGILLVRISRGTSENSDPTYVRLENFISFLKERRPGAEIHSIKIDPADTSGTYAALDDFFRAHPDIRNVAMLSSRAHIFAGYMKSRGITAFRFLGYDDIEENLQYLAGGEITYLITRHIDMQSYASLKSMSGYLIMNRRPEKDNFMHMDILTRFNNENY